MTYNYPNLNPEKALIWRIVHRDNIPWILDNGLHCGNSQRLSPTWVHIGNADLTSRRATHPVPLYTSRYLNDYVPFYFTPFSVMLRNILSGRGAVQRQKEEIVILVSSLHKIQELGLPFVFTDNHAYYQLANFYTDLSNLDKIDWPLLQRRDFVRDNNDPAKLDRYQAEALIHQHCPIDGIMGIICYTEQVKLHIETRNRGQKTES